MPPPDNDGRWVNAQGTGFGQRATTGSPMTTRVTATTMLDGYSMAVRGESTQQDHSRPAEDELNGERFAIGGMSREQMLLQNNQLTNLAIGTVVVINSSIPRANLLVAASKPMARQQECCTAPVNKGRWAIKQGTSHGRETTGGHPLTAAAAPMAVSRRHPHAN